MGEDTCTEALELLSMLLYLHKWDMVEGGFLFPPASAFLKNLAHNLSEDPQKINFCKSSFCGPKMLRL